MGSQLILIEGNVRRNLSDSASLNQPFFTSPEIRQYIGEAYKNYHHILVNEGEGYFETQTFISLVANQAAYPVTGLSPTFFSIHSIERKNSRGFFPLKERERIFRPNYSFGTTSGEGYFPNYRMQGMNILFEPTPQFSETDAMLLKYYYEPPFPNATSLDNFTFDSNFASSYEPMIELYATISALEAKDGIGGVSDINSFRERLKIQEDNFYKTINRFDYPDEVEFKGQNYSLPYWWYY